MWPVLQVGPLALPLPGLVALLGVWVGLSLAEREAARLGLSPEVVYNLAFTGLVAGLVGARLWYVSEYPGTFAAEPLSIVSLRPFALDAAGGVIIGAVAAGVYGARKKLPLAVTLDSLAPGLAAMGVALALAHLASGDAFGAPARLPWSIRLWDEYRHPSQVYELAGALVVLGAWRWGRGRWQSGGMSFLWVLALSAAARVFLEAFRGDSLILPGGFRAAQVAGLLVLAACLVTLARLRRLKWR